MNWLPSHSFFIETPLTTDMALLRLREFEQISKVKTDGSCIQTFQLHHQYISFQVPFPFILEGSGKIFKDIKGSTVIQLKLFLNRSTIKGLQWTLSSLLLGPFLIGLWLLSVSHNFLATASLLLTILIGISCLIYFPLYLVPFYWCTYRLRKHLYKILYSQSQK